LNAQDSLSISDELAFGEYLLKNDLLSEAELHFSNLSVLDLKQPVSDSINYFLGWTLYRQQVLGVSAERLLKVSPTSSFYDKSQFFAAFNFAFERRFDDGLNVLQKPQDSEVNEELRHFQRAGLYLLKRDLDGYEQEAKYFKGEFFAMSEEQKRFETYAEKIRGVKKRSPFVAGLFSAIVPGTGKIYAGKGRQGVAAFLPIAALGVQTWENQRKRGWDHPLTIVYAGLFSIFYVGNIWGSVLSVKIVNDETNEGIDQGILFDMHIPLRTIFAN